MIGIRRTVEEKFAQSRAYVVFFLREVGSASSLSLLQAGVSLNVIRSWLALILLPLQSRQQVIGRPIKVRAACAPWPL